MTWGFMPQIITYLVQNSVLAPACPRAPHHFLGGARHVVGEPEEHRLAGRHMRARPISGRERLQHTHELRVEHFRYGAVYRVLEARLVVRRRDVGVGIAERLQRAVVGVALEAIDRAGAEQREVMHSEERLPYALDGGGAGAVAVAPARIGELAEDAHALVAHARELERTAEQAAQLVAVEPAARRAIGEQHMRAVELELSARSVRARIDAGFLQAVDEEIPAWRRADDEHAFLEPQPRGDEFRERVEQAALLLLEVQHVLPASP